MGNDNKKVKKDFIVKCNNCGEELQFEKEILNGKGSKIYEIYCKYYEIGLECKCGNTND